MVKIFRFIDIRFVLVLITLFCGQEAVLAQDAICSVKGRIVDGGQNPVAYASVAIYNGNVPIAGVVASDDGSFSMKSKRSAMEYRLVVEFIGYKKYEGLIKPDKAQINVGNIILNEDVVTLDEVVVTAKEVAQKSTIERTTINASANMASSKGSAIDVLRTASSVSVLNDEISIRGNKNILVLMDGVPTTVSDLSTIPAANIKSIEVMTNPDASHDAGGTGGIINIISKHSRDEVFSGMGAINYGLNHFVNGNLAFMYNSRKASWRFNYNTKYEDDVVNTTLNRKVHSTSYEVFQQMQSSRYTFNNNFSLGADFRINARNRVSVDAKVIIPRLNIKQDIHNTFVDREELRHNDVNWNRVNIEGSATYTYVVKPEVSDIAIRASLSKIWGERPSHYWAAGVENYRSVSGGSPIIPTLQADYKYKFDVGTFSVGAKLTYRINDVYHEFYEAIGGGEWMHSDEMSNDLLHSEFVPAAYAMFASRIGKKFTYKVGLRGEFSTVTLDSKHDEVNERNDDFFLAPNVSGAYKLSKNQQLSMALSRRIGRPTYPQLIPYMSMVDATTYEQGNMHLNPEKATKVDLGYQFSGKVLIYLWMAI